MAHPHKGRAAETSREKFRAITGTRGGGHAHAGSSHMKKAGEHGVHKMWDGHKAGHIELKSHGGSSKPRADKYARGGKVKSKGPENVTINVTAAQPNPGPPPMPPMPPPQAPPAGGPPPGGPPPGGGMPPGGPGGGGGNPLAGLGKGMGGFARGGRAGHRDSAAHRLTGDSNYDLAHWRGYANEDKQKLASSRAGRVQARTQKLDKVQERAKGGAVKMHAGAMSGMGRLEQAKHQGRRHHVR